MAEWLKRQTAIPWVTGSIPAMDKYICLCGASTYSERNSEWGHAINQWWEIADLTLP